VPMLRPVTRSQLYPAGSLPPVGGELFVGLGDDVGDADGDGWPDVGWPDGVGLVGLDGWPDCVGLADGPVGVGPAEPG